MPKETIHGAAMPIDVEISWGADAEHVQVATVHDKGTEAMLAIVNEWLKAAQLPTVDYGQLQSKLTGPEFDWSSLAAFNGWHATFDDRRSVNRMIAVLRRARDHAFGKDE